MRPVKIKAPFLKVRLRRGFVLLEVLLSLMILGFALSAIMRSFTQSLKAVRQMEVQTQAQFFAMQLMHELEINPPDEGKSDGGFGADYKEFSFHLEVSYERPKYQRIEGAKDIQRYFAMRQMRITINYNDGVRPPYSPLSMETAVTGFEKFSAETKRAYGMF